MADMADETKAEGSPQRITREDVEAKIRRLVGDVDDATEKMRDVGTAVGAGLLALLLVIVFLVGRSKGRKKTTVVEVIRL
jgi:hypothetical protein